MNQGSNQTEDEIKAKMDQFYASKGLDKKLGPTNQNISSEQQNIPQPQVAPVQENSNPVVQQSHQQSVEDFQNAMMRNTDPDLMVTSESIDLPSKGLFYPNKISKLDVEYMTTTDEDLLTTPSYIEDGTVIDRLLERKLRNSPIPHDQLLPGDRSAILLYLRKSSYGDQYKVTAFDPRNNQPFEAVVDLNKLTYKEIKEMPDANGEFSVFITMRKKTVKFKLLNHYEVDYILKQAEAMKEASNSAVSQYNSNKLKAHIRSIDGNTDRTYINRFVDAMPAGDSFTIRRKIQDVSPDIKMQYEFTASDGFKFKAPLSMGVDFFFPSH